MIRLLRTVRKGRSSTTVLRYSLLAVFLFCGVLFAHGQSLAAKEPIRLTPDIAVDMAIKNNLNLETARVALDIKQRKAKLVWNEFLPDLNIMGTLARDNWASEVAGITLPNWHLTGSFNATLTFSFALIPGIQSFLRDYDAGLISYEKAKLMTEQGIRKMYNGILLLEANLSLFQESFDNAKSQAAIAEANYRAGLAPRLMWLQAQVGVENMRPTLDELENSHKNLLGNFALLLGLSYDTPLELEPLPLDVFYIPSDTEDLISKAATGKPDVQELQANIVTMQTQRKALATSQFTPFLRFGWTLSSMYNPILNPFKDSWKSDNWLNQGQYGGNFSITLGMSLNSLFPFTKEGQQRKDLEAGIQIQNIQLAQKIRETELEIFTTINSLEKTRTTKEVLQASVDLAEQSYNLTEEAYKSGLQDYQSVQNAALALQQAKIQVLTQQFNYLNDLIDLEYSIGVPFGTLSGSAK